MTTTQRSRRSSESSARNRGKVKGGGGEERSLFGRILIVVYVCVTILALYQILSVMGDYSAAFNDISVKE